MNAAQLRAVLIEVMASTREPMTTSAARIALSKRAGDRVRPVVAEEVYRALLILRSTPRT